MNVRGGHLNHEAKPSGLIKARLKRTIQMNHNMAIV